MNISDKNITTLLESRNEQALKLLSEKYGGLCSSISYNVLMWLKSSAIFPLTSFVITLAPSAVAKPMHCCQNLKNVFRQRTTQKNRQKTMSLNPFSTHF